MSNAEQSIRNLSQVSYKPTDWDDQSWEVVGRFEDSKEFVPAEFKVLPASDVTIDPMFADYGGLPPKSERRWHKAEYHVNDASQMRSREERREQEEQQQREQLEQVVEAARAQAFAEGLEQGRRESAQAHDAKLAELRQKIQTVLQDFQRQNVEMVQRVEQQAVGLSLDISKKIIAEAVEINPEYVFNVISEALKQCGTAIIRRVRVSPEDLEFLNLVGIEKHVKDFDGTWHFESDPSVRAGCVVDTSAGEVDFQLDKAWERVREKIIKVMR